SRTVRLVVRLRRIRRRRGAPPPPTGPRTRYTVVARRPRGHMDSTHRPRILDRGDRGPPGRPRLVERRPGIRPLGRSAATDRGRVGVRLPRRAGPSGLSLGRRTGTGWRTPLQHLAGRLSHPQPGLRRLPGNGPRRRLPTERSRPVQHRGQRVGMVRGPVEPRLARRGVCRYPGQPGRPTHRYGTGDPRRLLPVPPVLLHPLPGRGTDGEHPGQHDRTHGISLCRGPSRTARLSRGHTRNHTPPAPRTKGTPWAARSSSSPRTNNATTPTGATVARSPVHPSPTGSPRRGCGTNGPTAKTPSAARHARAC